MRTKIRISAALFCTLILSILGAGIFTYVFKTESRPERWITPFFASLFFISFLSVIIWRTLLIRIDEVSQTITFSYLFRFQRKSVHFRDITGFRFTYLNGRMEYKVIQFRSNDNQRFMVSDFETANLRELERFCLENFDLRAGKQFRALNQDEKHEEIKKSKNFDLSQAKTIRFHYYAGTISALILAAILIYRTITKDTFTIIGNVLPLIALIAVPAVVIPKISKVNRQIKTAQLQPDEPS